MKSVRQLRLPPQNYWKHQYAIIIMSHTKASYPIVRALLDLGMYVVAISRHYKQNEMLRHLLNKQQRRRYFTREVDLHTIMSINTLVMELELEVQKVKLLLCLVPLMNKEELNDIFEQRNAALLQTLLELNDLSIGALCAAASRHIIAEDYSHMWSIRFHHQQPQVVHDFIEYLIGLGKKAPRFLNANVVRKKEI